MPTSTYKAEKKNIPGILSWYEDQSISNFRIYAGFKPNNELGKYEYLGNDKAEGMELLEKYLNTIKEDNNTNKYSLFLVPKNPKTFAPVVTFQFNDNENTGSGFQNYNLNNELLSRLAAIENKLSSIDHQDEDEDEDEDENFLSGIAKDPQMKQMLYGIIGKLAGNMFGNNQPGIAGVPGSPQAKGTDNDFVELENILGELFAKGVTIEDLYLLSQYSKEKIDFLLSMLRK